MAGYGGHVIDSIKVMGAAAIRLKNQDPFLTTLMIAVR